MNRADAIVYAICIIVIVAGLVYLWEYC